MRRSLPLLALLVLGLLVAACAAPATTPVAQPTAAPTTATTETMEPQYGGTAILTTGDDFQGAAGDFDGSSTHDGRLFALYMDSLLVLRQDGTYEQRLAESITPSEDGLSWIVKIQPNAVWHDGTPITADDIIWSIDVMCSGKTNPPSSLLQYTTVVDCQEYRDGTATTTTGLVKIDDKTVEVKTDTVNAAMLTQLANLHPSPSHIWKDVPLDQLVQHPGWLDHPIGSGPFRMTNFVGDQVVEYEAFEDYYLGRPYLDKVIVRIAPYDTALAALEGGEVNLVTYLNILDAQRLASNADITIDRTRETRTWGLFFHFAQEPLRDLTVRKAFSMAIDRQAYNQAILGGFGNDQVKSWYTPGTFPAAPEIPADTYNPEMARQLLEEANFDFENNVVGIVILPANQPRAKIGEVLQANLTEIGVKSEIMPIEESTILDQWFLQREKIWFTIAYIGGTTAGDPYAWYPFFQTDSPTNWGFYPCNFASANANPDKIPALEACGNYVFGTPELDAAVKAALAETNREEAQPLFWEVDRLLHEYSPGVMVIGPANLFAWSSSLHGVPSGDEYDLQTWPHPELWWMAQ